MEKFNKDVTNFSSMLELLIKHGADLEAKDCEKYAPLHLAVREKQYEGVLKIAPYCDLNAIGGPKNETALHIAAT